MWWDMAEKGLQFNEYNRNRNIKWSGENCKLSQTWEGREDWFQSWMKSWFQLMIIIDKNHKGSAGPEETAGLVECFQVSEKKGIGDALIIWVMEIQNHFQKYQK